MSEEKTGLPTPEQTAELTGEIEPVSTEGYAWAQETDADHAQPDTENLATGSRSVVAIAVLSAVALAVALLAAAVVVVTPHPPVSHYVMGPAPVEQQAPPSAPPKPPAPRPSRPPVPRAPQPKQPQPPARPAPSHGQGGFSAAGNQRLLQGLRSLGYVIVDPSQVIAEGHHFCRLLQHGASIQGADRQMQTLMGTDTVDTDELDSSAQLAYPNCF